MIRLLKVLFPLVRLIEEARGEGRWWRSQWRGMVSERPPLGDAEFLEMVSASPLDAEMWHAVRRAMAESRGLPIEALHPGDRLADLWRMHFVGPDALNVVFRLEMSHGMKIPSAVVRKAFYEGRPEDFGAFAALIVPVLAELRQARNEGRC